MNTVDHIKNVVSNYGIKDAIVDVCLIPAVFAVVTTIGLLLAVGGIITVPVAIGIGAAFATIATGLLIRDAYHAWQDFGPSSV